MFELSKSENQKEIFFLHWKQYGRQNSIILILIDRIPQFEL